MSEIWKPIPSLFGTYEASSTGSIRRADGGPNTHRGKLIKLVPVSGYLGFTSSVKNVQKRQLVHRCVAESFLGPIPKGLVVNHLDGNKLNNNINNLEITTYSQNELHKKTLGIDTSERCHMSKLNRIIVAEIREMRRRGASLRTLALIFGVSKSNISFIVNNSTWKD